ncbi:hypothetical protein M501DRAFT_914447, partial [Patellaria atrata CBS 101060]
IERPSSPPAWVSPSLAIGACPQLDRSVSTASSVSSVSGRSSSSRLSDGGAGRRRGYMRPEGTMFAESARNRDSVMSLGTIAHLQYYFARTGLLDGKGAQLAKARKSGAAGSTERSVSAQSPASPNFMESPIEQDDAVQNWDYQEPMMLPPTVSTYKHRPAYVPPPPDMVVLRRELREALEDAQKVLKETEKRSYSGNQTSGGDQSSATEGQGFYEIEGLHLLDIATLAIKAARTYYTAHDAPQRLYSIVSERQLRRDLYGVLDILKRMATRNFAGGIRGTERDAIANWISNIGNLLTTEEEKEKVEIEEREKWSWQSGDWTGREREREWLFLRSFDPGPEELPTWTEPSDGTELPTPFLRIFQNGLKLVKLHNILVEKSRRQFEEIKVYHTDTAKPYRRAENLKFWMKAAQLRWEIKLKFDVMGVVQDTDSKAWRDFDTAILVWSKGVREEITSQWR